MSLPRVPDWPDNGVRGKGVSLWSFCESSIEIQSQEPCQDSTYSKSNPWEHKVLVDLEMVADEGDYPS